MFYSLLRAGETSWEKDESNITVNYTFIWLLMYVAAVYIMEWLKHIIHVVPGLASTHGASFHHILFDLFITYTTNTITSVFILSIPEMIVSVSKAAL